MHIAHSYPENLCFESLENIFGTIFQKSLHEKKTILVIFQYDFHLINIKKIEGWKLVKSRSFSTNWLTRALIADRS